MIVDAHGRRFRNLRVSLTAACNYACTYCVPNGKRLQAAVAELGPGGVAARGAPIGRDGRHRQAAHHRR